MPSKFPKQKRTPGPKPPAGLTEQLYAADKAAVKRPHPIRNLGRYAHPPAVKRRKP
jgi:hypothetical protein